MTIKDVVKQRNNIRKACWGVLSRYPSAIEDLVEDIIFHIAGRLDKFRAESSFETWVHRIATNQAINKLKKLKKEECLSLDASIGGTTEDIDFVDVLLGDGHYDPMPSIGRFHDLETIRNSLAWLREHHNTNYRALSLVVVYGFSNQFAAEYLGISPTSVRTRIFRARESLRKRLVTER